MDLIDENMDPRTLAARSILESENVKLLNNFIDDDEGKSQKKEKKKKLKSENQGNFSSYRNKSFVKNASRLPKGPLSGNSEERTEESEEGSNEEDDNEEDKEEEGEELSRSNLNLIKKKDKKKKKNGKLTTLLDSDSEDWY